MTSKHSNPLDSRLAPESNGSPAAEAEPQQGCRHRRSLKAPIRPTFESVHEDFTTILGLHRFPTELRLATLGEMVESGREVGISPALIGRMLSAIEFDRETYRRESAWAARTQARYSERTRELGRELSRALSALQKMVALTISAFAPDHPRYLAAQRLLGQAFPDGVAPLTQRSLRVQNKTVAVILQEVLLKDGAADVAILDLEASVENIANIHASFASSLRADTPAAPVANLELRRIEGQHRFGSLVIQILGAYPDRNPRSQMVRDVMMAPVLFHNDRFVQSLRKRRSPWRKQT